MIEVKDLVKSYGSLAAVDHVTFSVPKGNILGLLGPNGAGKTTTMRVLTTSLAMTSGKVAVDGYDVVDEPHEVRKRIGYLPEVPPIYNDMKVISYLKFVADIKEISREQKANRVGEVLEMLDLENMSHRLIGHLSLGYRQRVGLAQALIHDPDVLVLDEPTRGLDPKQILEIRKLIKSLKGRKTIILSTHILPEVSSTCDDVVIIDQGKVVAADSVDNLSQRLAGGKTLDVEIKGPSAEVEKAVSKLEGVVSVKMGDKETRGVCRLEVTTDGSVEVREALFQCVVKNKWALYQLTPMGMSLEDVFLKLTTKETAQ
ncbi:MAG TPA: ATP-binding cassette domain-containing protein [bacterium]|nr:ATP-binding cassette domain-containing protein [bacterium]